MRVKIPTTDLIEAVERRKKAALKSHEKALARYGRQLETALPKMVDALGAAAADLDAHGAEAKSVKLSYYRERGVELEIPTDIKLDDRPRPETSSLDYALNALQRTTDKTISLTPEELAWYTGEPDE